MPNHSLIGIQDEEGKDIITYTCPMVTADDHENAQSQILQGYLRYKPDATKLAQSSKYKRESIEETLFTFEERGDGGSLTGQGLVIFQNEAYRACIPHTESFQPQLEKLHQLKVTRLYCDLDGVLVDFEKGASAMFGKPIQEVPPKQLWSTAARTPGFYSNLPWMPDGKELWSAIKHLNPTILTAAPKGSWAEKQKREWVDRELGADVKMIVSTKKFEHCPQGVPIPILIDDRMIHCEAWQLAGGISIFHNDTKTTIQRLLELGEPVRGNTHQS